MRTKNLKLLFHSVRVGPVGVRLNSPWIQKGQNSQYSPQSCLVTTYSVLFCYSVSLREQTGHFLLFLRMARHIMGVAFSTEIASEVVEGTRHLPKRGEPLPSVGRRGGPPLYQWRQHRCNTSADEHDWTNIEWIILNILVFISLFRQLRRPSVSFKIQKGLSNSVAKKLDLFIALFFAIN